MTPKCGISLGHRDSWLHENIVKRVVYQHDVCIVETIYGDKYKASGDSVARSFPVKNKHVPVINFK